MFLQTGSVVKSTAGRDSGKLLAVIAFSEKNVLLCDGKERPFDRLKSKSIKHIQLTEYQLNESEMASNREIRRALKKCAEQNLT